MQTTNSSAASNDLSASTKSTLKIIFLTIFLDLVGFSIIFPLFPALAKHYLATDANNPFLIFIFSTVASITKFGGVGAQGQSIVLFGGILGALYSFLQFIFAPIWGALSDKIGRRPILLISISGMVLSYLLWIFSGSFTLLIAARIIGGMMGGNISTATAVVSDVTSQSNRSKGMAIIGIAFGLGFIFGPAFGGILSIVDFTKIFPNAVAYGINPFSAAATLACLFSLINLLYVAKKLPETLPPEKRGQVASTRTNNPFALLKPFPYQGVNLTNFAYFLFLIAFSGMEFTLTFLASERFNYSPKQNSYMFIFIGLLIALIQGGVVRRYAHKVGERKMALAGLLFVVPGLVIIGNAMTGGTLYAGLAFLAFGAATIVPCMTSLTSMYTPAQNQGQVIGVFRSLGALARVLGPFIAAMIYWRFGSATPYFSGALFLLLPIVLVMQLPKPTILSPES